MNLASMDLNLLVAFEALYDTRSVTLAGRRLNRAQPSVSNALSRLRTLFDDELFIRTADGMLPTERARALMPAIAQALDHIRAALAPTVPFDPLSARGRRFTIAATDYADIVLLPHLMAVLRREAPDIDVRVTSLHRATVYDQLDRAAVDIAIGGHFAPPKRMMAEPLYDERFVCIADRRHPRLRGRTLDLQTYLALPHALFVPNDDGSTRGVVDGRLDRLGRRRRVAATFAHVVALPYAVRGTDLIATIAERVAGMLAPAGVMTLPVPEALGDTTFSVDMVYSRGSQAEAGAAWLRRCVHTAVGTLSGVKG